MGNIIGLAVSVTAAILCFALWISIVVRIVRSRFGTVKSVYATVTDKCKTENGTYSKWQSLFPQKHFTVVFDVSGKRMSFYVSEYSYDGYHKGQRGTLIYKGNRIIDFKE